jgi:hypothetical protein
VTAFGPATIENSLARFCFHSGPETVGAVSFNIAGLKSSFAHGLFLFRKDDSKGRNLSWPLLQTNSGRKHVWVYGSFRRGERVVQ